MGCQTLNRRNVLATVLLSVIAPTALAEILRGPSAARHGLRSREVWIGARSLAGARIGRADGDIQVVFFVDLNCPACVQLWRWFDMPARRQWATLWVPVSHMHHSSTGRGIALLRSAQPRAALQENYGEGFDRSTRTGGLAVAEDETLAELSAIRVNTHFWRTSLFEATPITLYRRRDGTYWQLLGQLPEPQMGAAFSELGSAVLPVFKAPR